MANVTYDTQLTALLVIDPYNDFKGMESTRYPRSSCLAVRRETHVEVFVPGYGRLR
jgi:hypothetical protein